jgi:hypothetical protein
MKSRLPWLEGKATGVTSSSELRGPSPSPVSSPPVLKPPPFRKRSFLGEKKRPLVDCGLPSSPTSSDATPRPLSSSVRYRFSQPETDGKPPPRPVRGLRPPGVHSRIDPGSPSKIELVAQKVTLPVQREKLPMMQEPTKELRSRPKNIPLSMPVSHTWSSPEGWPTESSNSELVSPTNMTGHEKKRSFHEPELNAAINRMEDLMQQAGELVQEAADSGRSQEFSHIANEAATAFHKASRASEDHPSIRHRQPLRFRITNTSSESSFSSCGSSSVGTVVTKITHSSQPTVHEAYNYHGRHPRSENGFFADHDEDSAPNRGRSTHHQANGNQPANIFPGTRDFAYPGKNRSRSHSSSSHEHWMGRRPTRKFTTLPNAPNDTRPTKGLVLNPSPPLPLQGTLRQRRSTAHQNSPPPHPWVPPHHNTVYQPTDGEFRQSNTARGYVNWDKELSKKPKHRIKHRGLGLESRTYREGVRPRQTAVRVRRGSHVEQIHTRRDPIARRWGHFRKRFTATVACINTAIVGYIIGVYVC